MRKIIKKYFAAEIGRYKAASAFFRGFSRGPAFCALWLWNPASNVWRKLFPVVDLGGVMGRQKKKKVSMAAARFSAEFF